MEISMNYINNKRKFFKKLLFVVLSCSICHKAFSTEFSIDGVPFNEKMPSRKDNIEASLFDYDVSVKVLKNDVGAINSSLMKGHLIKIVGFTDNQECSGRECETLSLRRAQLIYDWMLANGVPKSRLLPPEGHGSSEPIDNNAISEGRARNRYVGFEIVPNVP
jgi:hypothetical protein